MDYPFSETFPVRPHIDELSAESEASLYEYYLEKSKRPFDWYFREAQQISGLADI